MIFSFVHFQDNTSKSESLSFARFVSCKPLTLRVLYSFLTPLRLLQDTGHKLESDGLFAHTRLSVCTSYNADTIIFKKNWNRSSNKLQKLENRPARVITSSGYDAGVDSLFHKLSWKGTSQRQI